MQNKYPSLFKMITKYNANVNVDVDFDKIAFKLESILKKRCIKLIEFMTGTEFKDEDDEIAKKLIDETQKLADGLVKVDKTIADIEQALDRFDKVNVTILYLLLLI